MNLFTFLRGKLAIFLVLFISLHTITAVKYITENDRSHIVKVFQLSAPYNDLELVHYSVLGLKVLQQPIPDEKGICTFLQSQLQSNKVDSLYFIAGIAKAISSCKVTFPAAAQQVLSSAINDDAPVTDLFYSVLALKNIGVKVDSSKVVKSLKAALKKDDSVLNLGYAFHIAAELDSEYSAFFDRVEDAVVQADEVDGKYSQFEGGLSNTAIIVSGIYRLAEKVGKAPGVTAEKCIQFTNYFLTRKHVKVPRAAYYLTHVLTLLTNNKFQMPVSVTIFGRTAVSLQEPNIQVRVTNVFGGSLGSLTVTLDSASRMADSKMLVQKKQLKPVPGDNSLYTINFMENKPGRGLYKLILTAVPSKDDARMIGNKAAQLEVKVMTDVTVQSLEIGTVELDQTSPAKLNKIDYPNKLQTVLEADHHQKLIVKFSLKDKNSGETMTAHQAFVSLINLNNKQEITFVAETDTSKNYKFDMDVNGRAKDFNYLSGRYSVGLIVGDAVVANSFSWHLGDVELSFPEHAGASLSVSSTDKTLTYSSKPEIKHLFRQPEKRPSSLVSSAFTVLAALPLLLLFICWIKLGVNVSNFKFTLGTVGFHVGLAAIFLLFVCFWLKLTMFSTLKYLLGIGVVTFLCGNNMLSRMASIRKH